MQTNIYLKSCYLYIALLTPQSDQWAAVLMMKSANTMQNSPVVNTCQAFQTFISESQRPYLFCPGRQGCCVNGMFYGRKPFLTPTLSTAFTIYGVDHVTKLCNAISHTENILYVF